MISIILTEDNEDDRAFFEEALKEIDIPVELLMLENGDALMANLIETVTISPPPHVIFLDLNMPKKNGFECIKEIKEIPKLKDIPIVIFSTSRNKPDIDKTFDLGANCYIRKPATHKDLKQLISSALSLNLWDDNKQLAKEKFVL
jgi:CheY-like chemotaxis protein